MKIIYTLYPLLSKQLIAIGYIDETNDMDFLYLHNTVIPLLDQRHLLEKENYNNE